MRQITLSCEPSHCAAGCIAGKMSLSIDWMLGARKLPVRSFPLPRRAAPWQASGLPVTRCFGAKWVLTRVPRANSVLFPA